MDTGPPSQQPDSFIRFDISYTRTLPGLLKAAVILWSFLGLVCNKNIFIRYSSIHHAHGALSGFYNFTAIIAIITSLFYGVLYLVPIPWAVRVGWAVRVIDWNFIELMNCATFCLFFAISSFGTLITISIGHDVHLGNIAAKVFATLFGTLATGFLGYDAFMKLSAHRRGVGPVDPGMVRPSNAATTTVQ